jgi:hypothetical protein
MTTPSSPIDEIERQLLELTITEDIKKIKMAETALAAAQAENKKLVDHINSLTERISKLETTYNEDNDSLCSGEINTQSNSFKEIGQIPDIVKELPRFDGEPTKLVQWLQDVDGIIELYTQFKGTHQYQIVLRSIRRKIVGDADAILINNNTKLSWKLIKNALLLHYSDRRDLMTLNSQLNLMNRKNDTIETFFTKIQSMHSLIANCIRIDPIYSGGEHHIIKLYGDICLDTFIRGVGSPLSQFLRNFKPTSLAQAYQYALEFQNTEYRTKITVPSTIPMFAPPIPSPRNVYQPDQKFNSRNFGQANFNKFNNMQTNRFQQNSNVQTFSNSTPRNVGNFSKDHRNFFPTNNYNSNQRFVNKSAEFSKPEPMDVDHSLRSRLSKQYPNIQQYSPVAPSNKPLARNAQDTPSWRVNQPPNKRLANIIQNEFNYETEENQIDEEDIQTYLNIANAQEEQAVEEYDQDQDEYDGNFHYRLDPEKIP